MTTQDTTGAGDPVTGSDVLTRAEGTVEAEVDGERILLSPSDFSYFGLAGTGAAVWDLIDGQRSVDDIIALLAAEYESEPDAIREDVLVFVDALKSTGLLA